jgi:hypothetical protein
VVPIVTQDTAVQAVGQLGAVIMPHNLYLHSALVLSRAVDRSDRAAVASANFYNAVESTLSLALSFVISSLVICVFASGFYGQAGANEAGLSTAGELLHDRFGGSIRFMWALGLLASGQSSTMTGTLAGQYVMQGFVDIDLVPWKRVLFTRSIAIVPAVLVAALYTSGLDQLNELLNVAQSIQLPFALLPLILFSGDATIMGEEYAIGERARAFLWTVFAALLAINVYLAQKLAIELIGTSALAIFCYLLVGALYFGFLAFILHHRLEHAAVARNIVPYEFLNDLSVNRGGGVSISGVAHADDHDAGPEGSDMSVEMMRVHQFYLARASNALFSISDDEGDDDASGSGGGAGSGGSEQSERQHYAIASAHGIELEDKDGL